MNQPSELLDRLPPQNLDAERSVLGSVLLHPAVLDEIGGTLKPESFYAHANALVWTHLRALHDARKPIDILTLADDLKASGDWEAIGGASYVAEVVNSVAVASHAAYYANLVRRAYQLRTIIHAGTEMIRDAYNASADPKELLAAAERTLGGIETTEQEAGAASAMQVAQEMVAHLDAVMNRTKAAGCLTGLIEFDQAIGGLFPGELAILAARPSVGKSALGLQVAYHAAASGRPCYVASLEMSRVELMLRLACGHAGVNSRLVRTAKVGPVELRLLSDAANEVATCSLWIHDQAGLSVYDIRRAARRIQRKSGLSLVVLDYLQLLTPADGRVNREQQVSTMTRSLKALARELDAPVLCLCQLNRASEEEGEPQLRHLRESGAIEQDADMVLFLGRRVSWLERERGEDKRRWSDRLEEERERSDFHTQAKLWLRKNRQGELGTFRLRWAPERTCFEAPSLPRYTEFDSPAEDF